MAATVLLQIERFFKLTRPQLPIHLPTYASRFFALTSTFSNLLRLLTFCALGHRVLVYTTRLF